MPYNGSGVFTIPNSFTPATTILSSAVNANFTDIATGLSTALPRDGQAAMTGGLRVVDGSEALPGIRWADDTNTGFRRSGADDIEIVTGATDRVLIDQDGKLWALFAFDAAGAAHFQAAVTMALTLGVTGVLSALAGIEVGHASDTTLTRTAAGTLAVEGNELYRAGGTDVAIADGGTGQSTAALGFAALKQAASDTASGVLEIATAAEMVTGTDVERAVVPGRVVNARGSAKAWGKVDATGNLVAGSYNVTSASLGGGNVFTVTLSVTMSGTDYVVVGNTLNLTSLNDLAASPTSATQFQVTIHDEGDSEQAQAFQFVVFGDLA